jgi:hypothetical protein
MKYVGKRSARGTLVKSSVSSGGAQIKSSVASVKALNDHSLCGIMAGTSQKNPRYLWLVPLWIARVLRKKGVSVFLSDLLRDQQLDFIGLQETTPYGSY